MITSTLSTYKNAIIGITLLIMAGALYLLYNKTVSLHDQNVKLKSDLKVVADENVKLVEYNKVATDLREEQFKKYTELETKQRTFSEKLRNYDNVITTQKLIVSALANRLAAQEQLNIEAKIYLDDINKHTAEMEKK